MADVGAKHDGVGGRPRSSRRPLAGELLEGGQALSERLIELLAATARVGDGAHRHLRAKPTVIMAVGVNGVGKTTTIGKLATNGLKRRDGKKSGARRGRHVPRGGGPAALRCGASASTSRWSRARRGADPGAVIFDAIKRAKEIGAKTSYRRYRGAAAHAGRPDGGARQDRRDDGRHGGRAARDAARVDATNGQNGMHQAAMFSEALPGSPASCSPSSTARLKGGIILGICSRAPAPRSRYIGIGERAEDLRHFRPGGVRARADRPGVIGGVVRPRPRLGGVI